nr:reverse transcriptase domain-containing protein [Tanacetum cinerariifolium]
MAAEGNDYLPIPDLRTICQPSLNGRGGPIAPIAIQATNLRLKNDMIQQVQNSCQFHGLPGDDANKHLDKFLHVTQSIKVKGVTDDALPTVGQTQNVYAAGAYQVSASRPNQRPSIPYLFRLHDQKLCDKANDQRENFFQIFKDLNFNISFADALILMSKFGPSIKSLLTNKDKLCELARTLLNEHCSVVLLKKLPENWETPLSLPDLSPTCMTLELVDRSISHSVGVAEVSSSKWTRRALIDVFEGKLTLRVGKEAITFNLDQTSRYSANYNYMTTKRIDVIDMACEEYSQEVLGFFDVIASGNPTPYYDPTVSTTSPTLTPFGNSDFFLKEVDAFLALEEVDAFLTLLKEFPANEQYPTTVHCLPYLP